MGLGVVFVKKGDKCVKNRVQRSGQSFSAAAGFLGSRFTRWVLALALQVMGHGFTHDEKSPDDRVLKFNWHDLPES